MSRAVIVILVLLLVGIGLVLVGGDLSRDAAVAEPEPGQGAQGKGGHVYVTWQRFEVDRFVAAWLIKRYLDSQAEFLLLPVGTSVTEPGHIAFDIPGGRWCRSSQQSTSELIAKELRCEVPQLAVLLKMVRKLELSYWISPSESELEAFQAGFMQIINRTEDPYEQLAQSLVYLDRVSAELAIDVDEAPKK